MRLSDVLSKEPDLEFKQVDGFLKKKYIQNQTLMMLMD